MRKTALISTPHLICYGFAIAAVLWLSPKASHAAEESKSDTIGPWEIEATFKSDKFDRCSISRKLDDDIVADFVRTDDGLSLVLSSPNWKLDRGKQYPVKINLGSLSFDDEVAAESNSVSIDKSTAAFERLDECVEKNSRAVETNPFVAPARQP